jgi:hypothetical protein
VTRWWPIALLLAVLAALAWPGSASASSGVQAENRVRGFDLVAQQLGDESQVFFRTSQGGRFVDQVVDGVAHEAKVGAQWLTSRTAAQIR